MLKQEIETKVLPDMEARLNNKIDSIIKMIEKEKDKNNRKQESVQICQLHHLVALSHHQTEKQKETNIILT